MCGQLRNILISVFIFVCVFSDSDESKEGSSCSQLGILGTCQKIKNCTLAIAKITHKGHHDLKRCGFEGQEEIVCCPDISERPYEIENTTMDGIIISDNDGPVIDIVNNIKTKRKSQTMCEKIYTENNIKPDILFNILRGDIAAAGQFPHMVAIGSEESDATIVWRCGGSLISTKFVLTAAHCFHCSGCAPVKVRLGTIDTNSESAQDYDIETYYLHPDYDYIAKHNDIALVQLKEDVKMSKTVYPACLYTKDDDPPFLQISRWGQPGDSEDTKATILQVDTLEPVPTSQCNSSVKTKVILDTQICAISNKSDSCVGASGSPLQIRQKEGGFLIVGVGSFGAAECGVSTKLLGVYTRVFKYLDWIENMVWPN